MTYAGLIRKNLGRKKLRLVLTLVSILVAFLIYGALGTFEAALNAGVELSGSNRLVTVNKISFIQPLPFGHYNRIQAIDGVEDVSYAVWFGGYYQEPQQILPVFAVDPESYLRVYPEIVVPDDQREAWLRNQRGALVGQGLASRFGWQVGDLIPIQSNIWTRTDGGSTYEMRIDGIFRGEDEQFDTTYMLAHYDYLNEARSFGKDNIGWMVLTTEDPSLNQEVATAIDTEFANSPNETKTSTEEAFNQAFLDQFGNISFIVTSVVSAAFITILLIAGNTMMITIRERTSEIAVMRTLGFSNVSVFLMILGESVMLTLAGGLPGLAIAWGLIEAAKTVLAGFLPALVMPPELVTSAIALMIGLGLVTGLVPAINALRINVVTALGRR